MKIKSLQVHIDKFNYPITLNVELDEGEEVLDVLLALQDTINSHLDVYKGNKPKPTLEIVSEIVEKWVK